VEKEKRKNLRIFRFFMWQKGWSYDTLEIVDK